MSAGIIGLKAFRKPNLGGGAAIVTLASNGAATVSPLVSNLVGYLVRKYQSRKLSREFPPDPRVKPLDESLKELALIKELQKDDATLQHSQLLAEATLLSDRSQHLDVVLDRESRDIERFRKVAQQQSISGPLIGLTGVAGSILGTIAFYDFRKNRDTTNKLLFSGRIPGIAGQSYALANTPCTIIAGIQRNRKLKIAGELPSEVLAERLRKMDALEKRIKSTSP
jgi:hypothetical protein